MTLLECTTKKLSNNQWLLLKLLSLSTNQMIIGETRLQKMVFMAQLTQKKSPLRTADGFQYLWKRWNYGPHATHLDKDIEDLWFFGYISIQKSSYIVKLTEKGKEALSSTSIKDEDNFLLSDIVEKFGLMDLSLFLTIIYKKTDLVHRYEVGGVMLTTNTNVQEDDCLFFENV